jgi:hypothetical protein
LKTNSRKPATKPWALRSLTALFTIARRFSLSLPYVARSRLTASFGVARNPDYLCSGDAGQGRLSTIVSHIRASSRPRPGNCCAHCTRPIHNRSRHAAPNAICEH